MAEPRWANHYNSLYQNATAGDGMTIQDLRPVAGSAAETAGAYRRLGELLGTGG